MTTAFMGSCIAAESCSAALGNAGAEEKRAACDAASSTGCVAYKGGRSLRGTHSRCQPGAEYLSSNLLCTRSMVARTCLLSSPYKVQASNSCCGMQSQLKLPARVLKRSQCPRTCAVDGWKLTPQDTDRPLAFV